MNTGEEIADIVRDRCSANPLPRFRTQTGVLVEYSDGWYCRYYDDDPKDAHKRKRVAVWLCASDTEREVRERLQAAHIKVVNRAQAFTVVCAVTPERKPTP
jgi:hypothetical protein